jgi:2-C-methyl-D-erythritol 4-phosphate cytidylyltransferase/2-C-methyl-D-erythritol 2,4-cyclodiphosphate synthase
MRVCAIIVAGGRGERLGAGTPKQFLAIAGRSLLQRSIDALLACPLVHEAVVVVPADYVGRAGELIGLERSRVKVTAGGARRQDSVAAGFGLVDEIVDVVLVHDAARPFVTADLVRRVVAAAAEHGAAIAALPARDTVKRGAPWHGTTRIVETIPRDTVHLAQTPQGFRRHVLADAIAQGRAGHEGTDEAALAELAGHPVVLVEGDVLNIKVTTPDDLPIAEAIAATGGPTREDGGQGPRLGPALRVQHGRTSMQAPTRIGLGYDSHRFAEGRELILGGVRVPFDRGLAGHSDADAVSHAITDALLGALNLGDIGQLFPDTDPRWRDADSLMMLKAAVGRVHAAGYRVGNVDVVVVCERPKIGPHADAMRAALGAVLDVPPDAISIKGKTNEGMDAAGRGEGLVVHAIATVMALASS